MIRKDFIIRKISLIQDDLAHLTLFTKYSFDDIAKDFMKNAAMERILERIINRAIDINQHLVAELDQLSLSPPKDYKETFELLAKLKIYPEKFAKEISKSISTRNKLTHEYEDIDHEMIYRSVKDCLKDYNRYCSFILKYLKKFK